MSTLLNFLRRHWGAILALLYLAWRGSFPEARSSPSYAICITLAGVGIAMNLFVILANRGMPVSARQDEISEADRPHYHPVDPSTRLAFLADWIPCGNLLMSPGDILLLFSVAILVLRPLLV